ncbi:hypothetical protein Pst134EB_003801 [Puccinia striiformis f. sp. tritici]|nr:hypothetical protein Pst134EB_003801 [Puccinia striiformis f. sp. tritici]
MYLPVNPVEIGVQGSRVGLVERRSRGTKPAAVRDSNPVINRTWINNFDQADLQGRITDSTSGTPGSAQEPALTVPEPKGTGVESNQRLSSRLS